LVVSEFGKGLEVDFEVFAMEGFNAFEQLGCGFHLLLQFAFLDQFLR
jgi:hypothetical protein